MGGRRWWLCGWNSDVLPDLHLSSAPSGLPRLSSEVMSLSMSKSPNFHKSHFFHFGVELGLFPQWEMSSGKATGGDWPSSGFCQKVISFFRPPSPNQMASSEIRTLFTSLCQIRILDSKKGVNVMSIWKFVKTQGDIWSLLDWNWFIRNSNTREPEWIGRKAGLAQLVVS